MRNNFLNNFQNNSGEINSPQKNKLDLKSCKKNTINSLYTVEYFLNNFNCFIKSYKIYKFIRFFKK